MQPKFKQDDFCFSEFRLKQVTRTEENRITAVSDGLFSTSAYDLSDQCYPLTLPIKVISDAVAYYSTKFHSLKNNSLNHPDLNRKLIEIWIEMCDLVDDDKALRNKYKELDQFGEEVIKTVQNTLNQVVSGVQLFTR